MQRLWPPLLLLLFLTTLCACEKNEPPPAFIAPQNTEKHEQAAEAGHDIAAVGAVSDKALRVLSCTELKPVVEKTVERLKLDSRMPPIEISYMPSEEHPGEIVKGALRYNVLLTEGKENWKLLAERGLTREKDGISLARNRIVFVTLQSRNSGNDPVKFLAGLPDIRIGLPHPLNTLAGIHAQQSLIRLGLWKKDERKGLWLDDRAEAVAALSDGRADAAVIYNSDAVQHPGLKVLFAAPKGSHFDVVYYGLHIKGSGLRDAARYFLVELSGPESGADWQAAGFLPPPSGEP